MEKKDKIRELEARRLMGRRVRRRRQYLNMTQKALAGTLGVTFQLVQKYENGATRISELRLGQISRALEVSPEYFSDWRAERADAFENFLQSKDGMNLYRAVSLIPDGSERSRLIAAIEVYCEGEIQPEDRESAMVTDWFGRVAKDRTPERYYGNAATAVHNMKVELARLIGHTLKARKLTQKLAGEVLHTTQARVSNLAQGNVKAVSFEKLLRFLVLLGWDTRVIVARRPANREGKVALSLQRDIVSGKPRASR